MYSLILWLYKYRYIIYICMYIGRSCCVVRLPGPSRYAHERDVTFILVASHSLSSSVASGFRQSRPRFFNGLSDFSYSAEIDDVHHTW